MFSDPKSYRKNPQTGRQRNGIYFEHPILSVTLFLALVCLIAYNVYARYLAPAVVFIPKENKNSLSIDSSLSGNLIIPINNPSSLSGLKLSSLLSIRESATTPYKNMLINSYQPSDEVFGRLQDGLVWYSMDNFYRLGPSKTNHDKESVESLAFENPLMFVVPEFWGISIWAEKKRKWKNPDYAPAINLLAPLPSTHKWTPSEKKALLTYNLTEHLEQVNPYLETPLTVADIDFGVSAYNAVDFGFSYMRFSPEKSESFSASKGTQPIKIKDYLGVKNSVCGTKCNHRSNAMPDFDTFKPLNLPAKGVFELWINEPIPNEDNSLPSADFWYIIDLK